MDILTIDDVRELVNVNEEIFISIYLPTFSSGVDIRQNPVKFKQLLRKAEAELYNMGMRKQDIETLLKPATDLVGETKFWQNQSEGLAVYIYPGEIKYYRLPFQFKECVTVSDKLHIKPLLPLFTGNGQFLVMALSKGQIRLFRCSRQNIKEIELAGAPDSVFDMQVDDDYRTNLLRRTSSPQGGSSLVYNTVTQGQGNENDYEKNELTRYFRAIDDSLMRMFEGENIPLVLAGVEYLIPIYKEKSNYPNIVEEFIKGNPEMLNGNELHKLAWEIVEPIFIEEQQKAMEKFNQFSGQKTTCFQQSLIKSWLQHILGR